METRHDLGPAYATLAGEGEETWFQPNRMTIKPGREHTAGAYGLLETWPPPGPPDVERLKQVSAEFGAEIVGPSLQPKIA